MPGRCRNTGAVLRHRGEIEDLVTNCGGVVVPTTGKRSDRQSTACDTVSIDCMIEICRLHIPRRVGGHVLNAERLYMYMYNEHVALLNVS